MSSGAGQRPIIVGRSSSHFTRITRIFAAELGVDYELAVVPDLLSQDARDYAGNPALKLPSLRTERGVWFGALNVCRELARRSARGLRLVWPEDLLEPVAANAQELVLQGMATEVALIMSRAAGATAAGEGKPARSLRGTLDWLEGNAPSALAALPPERDLSYLEVSLFCFVAHLEFRDVVKLEPYPVLRGLRDGFAERRSASVTDYRFDA